MRRCGGGVVVACSCGTSQMNTGDRRKTQMCKTKRHGFFIVELPSYERVFLQ